jgi:hypothetical protein
MEFFSSSSSYFSFIFASDIFVLTSFTTAIAKNFSTDSTDPTTPDDGFGLAETCRDIRV